MDARKKGREENRRERYEKTHREGKIVRREGRKGRSEGLIDGLM